MWSLARYMSLSAQFPLDKTCPSYGIKAHTHQRQHQQQPTCRSALCSAQTRAYIQMCRLMKWHQKAAASVLTIRYGGRGLKSPEQLYLNTHVNWDTSDSAVDCGRLFVRKKNLLSVTVYNHNLFLANSDVSLFRTLTCDHFSLLSSHHVFPVTQELMLQYLHWFCCSKWSRFINGENRFNNP